MVSVLKVTIKGAAWSLKRKKNASGRKVLTHFCKVKCRF